MFNVLLHPPCMHFTAEYVDKREKWLDNLVHSLFIYYSSAFQVLQSLFQSVFYVSISDMTF